MTDPLESLNALFTFLSVSDRLSQSTDYSAAENRNSSGIIQSLKNKKSEIENQLIINDNINSTLTNTMATPKEVFDNLRIPDVIKALPEFDGNPRLLFDFINNVEEILSVIPQAQASYLRLILRSIRNKIVGQANEILNMYGTTLNWEQIKANLITHYSDKRSEINLIKDLHQLSQGSLTLEVFYSKIIEIHSTMVNHVTIHEANKDIILSKQKLYGDLCLTTFLSGLREPIGSTIRAMRPSTLLEAFNLCLQEQNISYGRTHIYRQKTQYPTFQNTPKQPQNFTHTQFKRNHTQTRTSHPQQTYRFNNPHPAFQQQRSNPSMFRSNPTITQNQTAPQFPRNPATTQYKPTPMDISSGNTIRRPPQQNNYFRPTGPPNFSSKELFNTESQYYNDLTQYQDNDTQYYAEDANFPQQYHESQNPDTYNQSDVRENYCDQQDEISDEPFNLNFQMPASRRESGT